MRPVCEPRLRALRPTRISIPSASAFWTATLHDPTSDVLVPVSRSFRTPNEGWATVPQAGTYELVIRVASQLPGIEDDPEPFWCFAVMPNGGQRYLNLTTSVFPAAWEYCRLGKPSTPGFLAKPPPTKLPEDAIVFRRSFAFRESGRATDRTAAAEAIAYSVYGEQLGAMAEGGLGSIGYWMRRSAVSVVPGELDYSTEPVGCALSFEKTFRQESCNYTEPSYAWHPLNRPPEDRIRSANETANCADAKKLSVVGDSLGHALYRGIRCVTGGYASVQDFPRAIQIVHHAPSLMVLFTPLDTRLDITYEDFVQLLYNSDGRTDFIWHFGTWMISYSPSSDWIRGLRRFAKYANRHAAQTGAVHWLSFVTSPFWGGYPAAGPGWQTPGRTFEWNRRILQIAATYNLTVVDLFTPTSARTDGRLDNCHYCDYVMYEVAHIAYSAVCNA